MESDAVFRLIPGSQEHPVISTLRLVSLGNGVDADAPTAWPEFSVTDELNVSSMIYLTVQIAEAGKPNSTLVMLDGEQLTQLTQWLAVAKQFMDADPENQPSGSE